MAENTPADPAAAQTSVPSTTPAPVAAAKAPEVVTPEPTFLRDRLDREAKNVLKSLGIKVKKGEDPKAKVEEFKADQETRKGERKELRNKIAEHEATITKLSSAEAAVKIFAEMEFAALDEKQQAVVKTAAGDDPNERLKTIAMMKATGMLVAAPKAAAPAAAVPAPIAAPAQTAPAQSAPAVASSAPTDVRAEHARLQSSNPLAAAAYLLQNRYEYYKQS